MSLHTSFLSRLIGLYCILTSLSMMVHKQAIVETVTLFLHNTALMLALGVIVLIAGLAMVLAHNIWSGGALAVTVTVIGWLTLLKGLFFLFLPSEVVTEFYLGGLRYEQYFYLYGVAILVIGICITYGGFRSKAQS